MTILQPIELPLLEETLSAINTHLTPLTPQQILEWALTNLPGLYQTTAFGLTGLVAIDMLSKLSSSPPPLIFLDTLYHFPETYELVEDVKKRYGRNVNVYKPQGCADVKAFETQHGDKLWETNENSYDWAVKVRSRHFSLIYGSSLNKHRSIGRTCSTSIPRAGCSISHNWSSSLARGRSRQSQTP